LLFANLAKLYRFSWGEICIIPGFEIHSIELSSVVKHPNGFLIKGARPSVYVVSGGQRRFIINTTVFESLGYRWGNIITISDADLNSCVAVFVDI